MAASNVLLSRAASFGQPELFQETRKHIELEIIALKVRRNALLPVSRLPPEILSDILVIISQSYCKPSVVHRLLPPTLAWVALSHVCHYWREVALTTPGLWSYLPLFNSRWTEEMLIRSMPMPVVYQIDMNCRAVPRIKIDPHRAREIHIYGNISTIREHLEAVVTLAPVLERITFTLTQMIGEVYYSVIDLSRVMAPRLQSMHTLCCIRGLIAPRLTHLSIYHPSFAHPTTTLSQLLILFEGLPSLRNLSLKNAFKILRLRPHRAPVTLANLQSLVLLHTTHGCSQLLEYIISLTAITLEVRCDEPCPDSGFASLHSAVREHTSAIRGPEPLRCIWIRIARPLRRLGYGWNLRLEAQSTLPHGIHFNEVSGPQVGFDLSWEESEYVDIGDLLGSLCQSVYLGNIESLQVDFHDTEVTCIVSPAAWAYALEGMTAVHTLRVHCNDGQMSRTRGLFLAIQGLQQNSSTEADGLNMAPPYASAAHPRRDILPRLGKIVFEHVDFTGNLFPSHRPFFDVLKIILKTRMGSHVNPMEVALESCSNVSKEHIYQLEEIIGSVTWDGRENSSGCR